MINTPYTIRQTLYELKQAYGNYAVLCKRILNSVDLKTGVKDVTENIYEIWKAILLPSKLLTKYFHLNQLPDFKYGGYQDLEDRMVIIDEQDLPKSIASTIEPEDYLFIEHKRYKVVSAQEWEYKAAYLLIVKQVKNQPIEEIIICRAFDNIFLVDTLTSGVASDTLVLSDLATYVLN